MNGRARTEAGVGSPAGWLALLSAGGACLLLSAAAYAALHGEVVYEKDSLYHRIMVHRQGSVVTLRFGRDDPGLVQSQVDLDNPWRHVNEYTTLAYAGLLHHPEPESVLVLGLGGGVIPQDMRRYFRELKIDVVELDEEVLPVAERFFEFSQDERMKVHISDGRVFIRRKLRENPVPKYDIIVLDAFLGDYIPFHLMTKEFLEQVRGVLADDGVVVANVFYTNQLCHAEMQTFLAVFGDCQLYRGAYSGNAMLVSPGPGAPVLTYEAAAERAAELQEKHAFAFDLRTVAAKLIPNARPRPGSPVLTDDQAPVNVLRYLESEPPAPEETPLARPSE